MQPPFVHLHVHSQYSVLDGQASIQALVDKAMKDGQPGMALTDHGNMFGIKEFFNYVKKKNGGTKDKIKDLKEKLAALEQSENSEEKEKSIAECQEAIAAEEAKIFKPILGCEMYVARRSMDSRGDKVDAGGWHLIVLAKNLKGYKNLIKLVSNAWTRGYYYHPRTDKEELEKYHEGLIICSACLGGELPQKIMKQDVAAAEETARWFKSIWGDDYYIELQRHKATVPRAAHDTYEKQIEVEKVMLEIARRNNIKVICTNDVHFVNEENAEAHDRLICLNTGKDLDDPNRMLYTKQEWFKNREEMAAVFSDIPEAMANTLEILDKVEFYTIDHAPIMPTFAIPEEFGTEEEYRAKYTEEDLFNEFTRDENGNVVLSEDEAHDKIKKLGGYEKLYRIKLEADYLKKLAFEGAAKRYPMPLSDEVMERMTFELHIMKTMGFPGYFLIVQDFIAAARSMGVSVGPGRGSAAGSCVAYCLGITQIDPIKYDLLFERFLNPDRISLPDIDIDFDDDGRGEVLNWVTEKYGHEKVAHIITYGTMATKLAIKDVARVQKVPIPESDKLTKLIPDRLPEMDGKPMKMNLKNCIATVAELRDACSSPDPKIADTMRYAQMLEGNVRNTGVHACGVIIGRDDITDWVPVSTADDKTTGEKMLVTQYEGSVIEDTGMIKMDFLGLKTLSIIKEAIENIRLRTGKVVDIDNIPIDDPATYKLYCEGRTTGTFQFESPGMQKYLRELQPSTFEDLIAMNALYRPGPMDYIPQFIARKHGREPITYDIPIMEKYLKDTYGITVYQEQVMLLSRLLADFTRGESDALRKAMGKKLKDKLDELKPKFINGGKKHDYDETILEKIWGDWEKFASYAFNKSHATCYSWVAFQTAYLKANYPSEYMAAVLSRNLSDIADVTKFMSECKAMKIEVLGPDVNESQLKFSVNKRGDIRFGLGAIKGVGEAAVMAIISEREKNGNFTSIFDFVERVNLSACGKKTIESLATAGAFDTFTEVKRENFLPAAEGEISFVDTLVRYGQRVQNDRASQVTSLWGDAVMESTTAKPQIPQVFEEAQITRLEREKSLVGLYLSAHPLDPYKLELKYGCNIRMSELKNKASLVGKDLVFGGVVLGLRERVAQNGNPYAFLKIEDYSGAEEIPLFGKDYVKYGNYGRTGSSTFVLVRATYEVSKYDSSKINLVIRSMDLLADLQGKLFSKLAISLSLDTLTPAFIESLSDLMHETSHNNIEVTFRIVDEKINRHITMRSRRKCMLTAELIDFLRDWEAYRDDDGNTDENKVLNSSISFKLS
ncbi:MAG: DNA polymerase III subunit alpha [Bacteroidaceae bacterium]|nr:DNA polymerase III subunit alpha [Bacteroidaceae bacterium]